MNRLVRGIVRAVAVDSKVVDAARERFAEVATRLRIVIVSYVDDNFGDNLIRISFQQLLHVALENHGLTREDYELAPMALKQVDEDLLGGADAIVFAGGGLFGVSYLNFFEHVDRITSIAERRGIPVIFSSMGMNNMGAEGGSVDAIAEVVRRSCVKAIAVRENLELFQELVQGLPFEVRQVADPAVWTKYVYGMTDVVPDGTMGINVVRGGLFAANKRSWGLTAQMRYLAELRDLAQAAGTPVQLYTNGSLDDNNTLRYFAREHKISAEQVVLPQTTREVVEAVATRSSIASIRMHSSIIAYSFGIPTVTLEWNDKIPYFYRAIGHPERVLPVGEWSAERSFEILQGAGVAPEHHEGYRDYLMSTYDYIHAALGEHLLGGRGGAERQGFQEVADALVRRSVELDEDEFDLRVKLGKAERAYLGRFITLRTRDAQIRDGKKEVAALSEEVGALNQRIANLSTQVTTLETRVREQNRELATRLPARVRRFASRVRRGVSERVGSS